MKSCDDVNWAIITAMMFVEEGVDAEQWRDFKTMVKISCKYLAAKCRYF